MLRKIVSISEELCNGCGLCVTACHEGAIELVNGKARLVSDIYCDGLGDCLPSCPTGAIEIVEREADPFDQDAVQERVSQTKGEPPIGGCPGMRNFSIEEDPKVSDEEVTGGFRPSRLKSWPVQLHLLNPAAKQLNGVHLLLAADCTAFACAGIHEQYMNGRTVTIACPKLDNRSGYEEKLAAILKHQKIKSLTVLRMVVPCCSGITQIAKKAVDSSGVEVPIEEIVLDLDGSEANINYWED